MDLCWKPSPNLHHRTYQEETPLSLLYPSSSIVHVVDHQSADAGHNPKKETEPPSNTKDDATQSQKPTVHLQSKQVQHRSQQPINHLALVRHRNT
ncbi:hypothetical protein DY000_02063277 [Brassica cretica]|uniref:Uncharacterized protein n=1 Tax=Brassica cretica TaxID=69181 RepID=A0ABQ7AZF2_BRACR|nr:hypothetical protein DY000_02063277 [Brassica cretica]